MLSNGKPSIADVPSVFGVKSGYSDEDKGESLI